MWKKHGTALLGIILTLAILLTGVKLPEYVAAAGNDKTNLAKNVNVTIYQQDSSNVEKPVTGAINTANYIRMDVSFNAVFNNSLTEENRINKGDYIQFDLGSKLKLNGSVNEVVRPVEDTASKLKICDAIFTCDDDGNIKVKFDFSNTDDAVFEKDSTSIGASVTLITDLSKFDFTTTNEKVIRIFGKDYQLGEIVGDVNLTKTGVLDVKNSKIDWTITAERYVRGSSPRAPLSLEGYTFRDYPKGGVNGNNFIEGTFTINGKSRDASSGLSIATLRDTGYTNIMYYTVKADDLDPSNVGKAVLKYSTDVNFGGDFGSSGVRNYPNDIHLVKYGTSQFWSKHRDVTVRKMGEKLGSFNAGTKTITWTVEFNRPEYDLGDVTISDELTKDKTGRIPQKFEKAYVQTFDKTKNTWKEEKTELTPVVSGDNHTFTIPNVKERFLLTILTKVDADNYSSRFDNDAYVWWNNNIKFKTKLHASILDVHGGNGQIGTINKTAKSQLAVSSDNAFDAGLGEYISNEPEWTMTADKNTVAAPGDYYMYDAFIFDKNVRVDSDTINSTNGYSLRKLGESTAATLASGISLEKLFSKNPAGDETMGRHQKLMNINKPITEATSGVTNNVYEVVKDGNVVGHVLEVKLVQGVDNFVKFKSKVMEHNLIVSEREDGLNRLQNYYLLASGGNVLLNKMVEYHYQSKLLDKQVLSRTAAKKFLTDYDVAAANNDVFDANNKIAIDNTETAYDKETRSVVFKISVNAKDIKDVQGDIGKFVLSDELSYHLKLVPIKKEEGRDKYFLIYKGEPALKYKDTAEADHRFGKFAHIPSDRARSVGSIVNAVGEPLSDKEISDNNIFALLDKDYHNNYDKIRFTFDKLNSPYVIFVKAELKSDEPMNEIGQVWNNAKMWIQGDERAYIQIEKTAKADYDDRFLWKNYDGDKIFIDKNGYIKWNLFYKPYKVYNDNNETKLRLEDQLKGNLVLRKEKGTANLAFNDDNYKIWKGNFDAEGNFVNPVEITEGLDKIFVYDLEQKKLIVNIPDNDTSYKISYITDFAPDAKKGDELENDVVLIEKSKQIGQKVGVKHSIEANAWGSLKDINYDKLQIVKKNADGEELAGAEFRLRRLADSNVTEQDMGTVKTVTDGAVMFENIVAGSYELTETKAPEGYETNGVTYKIKVVELENGDLNVALDGNYEGQATLEKRVLTVINKKKPETPPTPVNPTPENPKKPVDPPTPENPTPLIPVTPKTPDTPNPTPSIPSYPINNTPNPNDPNSPDEFEVIGNDGTPQGKVVKVTKPNGKKEYVFEDDKTPLDGFKAKKNRKALPKTGGAATTWYYAAGAGLVLMAGFAFRRRKEEI